MPRYYRIHAVERIPGISMSIDATEVYESHQTPPEAEERSVLPEDFHEFSGLLTRKSLAETVCRYLRRRNGLKKFSVQMIETPEKLPTHNDEAEAFVAKMKKEREEFKNGPRWYQ